jgi:hypothetical protein
MQDLHKAPYELKDQFYDAWKLKYKFYMHNQKN